MPYKKIKKQDYPDFVANLGKSTRVMAPVEREGKFVFAEIDGGDGVADGYTPTLIPPKKYMFPVAPRLTRFNGLSSTTPMIRITWSSSSQEK